MTDRIDMIREAKARLDRNRQEAAWGQLLFQLQWLYGAANVRIEENRPDVVKAQPRKDAVLTKQAAITEGLRGRYGL